MLIIPSSRCLGIRYWLSCITDFFFIILNVSLQQEYKDKYKLSDATFDKYICLEEPKFTHSKAPVKAAGGSKKKKNKRSDEEIELINQAKEKAKEAKEAKVKQSKEEKLKGKTEYECLNSVAVELK